MHTLREYYGLVGVDSALKTLKKSIHDQIIASENGSDSLETISFPTHLSSRKKRYAPETDEFSKTRRKWYRYMTDYLQDTRKFKDYFLAKLFQVFVRGKYLKNDTILNTLGFIDNYILQKYYVSDVAKYMIEKLYVSMYGYQHYQDFCKIMSIRGNNHNYPRFPINELGPVFYFRDTVMPVKIRNSLKDYFSVNPNQSSFSITNDDLFSAFEFIIQETFVDHFDMIVNPLYRNKTTCYYVNDVIQNMWKTQFWQDCMKYDFNIISNYGFWIRFSIMNCLTPNVLKSMVKYLMESIGYTCPPEKQGQDCLEYIKLCFDIRPSQCFAIALVQSFNNTQRTSRTQVNPYSHLVRRDIIQSSPYTDIYTLCVIWNHYNPIIDKCWMNSDQFGYGDQSFTSFTDTKNTNSMESRKLDAVTNVTAEKNTNIQPNYITNKKTFQPPRPVLDLDLNGTNPSFIEPCNFIFDSVTKKRLETRKFEPFKPMELNEVIRELENRASVPIIPIVQTLKNDSIQMVTPRKIYDISKASWMNPKNPNNVSDLNQKDSKMEPRDPIRSQKELETPFMNHFRTKYLDTTQYKSLSTIDDFVSIPNPANDWEYILIPK